MKITCEDMFEVAEYSKNPFIVFSANGIKTKEGKLVMGAGAAKAVRDRFPGIDTELGKFINGDDDYYVVSYPLRHCTVVALQVKRHWREKANIQLIDKSLARLAEWIEIYSPNQQWIMNCPGIGFGGLSISNIGNLLGKNLFKFPNVTVCVTDPDQASALDYLTT